MKNHIALLFAFVVMALGLGTALYSYKKINLARASLSWPQIPARIISSEVKATERTAERKRAYTTYRADIAFSYKINGTEFTSHQPVIDQPEKTFAADAEALVARFPAGKSVMARYNPANNFEAVLESGISPSSYVAFIFGSLLTLTGMGWFGVRMRPTPREGHVIVLG